MDDLKKLVTVQHMLLVLKELVTVQQLQLVVEVPGGGTLHSGAPCARAAKAEQTTSDESQRMSYSELH